MISNSVSENSFTIDLGVTVVGVNILLLVHS